MVLPSNAIVDRIFDDIQMSLARFLVLGAQIVDQMILCVPCEDFQYLYAPDEIQRGEIELPAN